MLTKHYMRRLNSWKQKPASVSLLQNKSLSRALSYNKYCTLTLPLFCITRIKQNRETQTYSETALESVQVRIKQKEQTGNSAFHINDVAEVNNGVTACCL